MKKIMITFLMIIGINVYGGIKNNKFSLEISAALKKFNQRIDAKFGKDPKEQNEYLEEDLQNQKLKGTPQIIASEHKGSLSKK